MCDKRLGADKEGSNVEYKLSLTQEQKFGYSFRVKVLQDLREQHPWASIFTCSPNSTFTRVQRLSCCFAIGMSAMLINLMFYEAKSKSHMLETLRSYQVELDNFIIGAQSAVMNIPINMLIIFIFKYAAPKNPPSYLLGGDDEDCETNSSEESSGSSELMESASQNTENDPASSTSDSEEQVINTSESSASDSDEQHNNTSEFSVSTSNEHLNKASPGFRLPWWCVFIAWTLVFVKCTVSSYATIMYGLSYGYDKSMAWLRSFLMAATSDIGVFQPAKVAITVCIFVLILKRPVQPITNLAITLGE